MDKKLEKLQESGDRISGMPNEVLTQILSLLPTKDAVGTSVLSKKWKPLWGCVPALDLTDTDFCKEESDSGDVERRQATFLDFLYKFLFLLRGTSITRFCLRCFETYDPKLVISWIYYVIKHNVKELLLHAFLREKAYRGKIELCLRKVEDPLVTNEKNMIYTGSCCLETSEESILHYWMCAVDLLKATDLELYLKSDMEMEKFPPFFPFGILVVLKLEGVFLYFPIDSVCFPKLKVLRLIDVTFESGNSASYLISSSCPMLKELEMRRTEEDNIDILAITPHTLESLSIYCPPTDEFRDVRVHETIVNTPNLQNLALEGFLDGKYTFTNMSLLVELELKCGIEDHECYIELLKLASNINCLLITCWAIMRLNDVKSRLPPLHKLTSLTIESEYKPDNCSWDLMQMFLHSAPNLKHLMSGVIFNTLELDLELALHADLPNCLVVGLETVELHIELTLDYLYHKIVQYFLRSSKVLKTMRIKHVQTQGFEFKEEIKQGIQANFNQAVLTYPKASATCQIEFL